MDKRTLDKKLKLMTKIYGFESWHWREYTSLHMQLRSADAWRFLDETVLIILERKNKIEKIKQKLKYIKV